MLKRPPFLKYLIISYFVFAIYAFIQYLMIASIPIDSSLVLKNIESYSTNTVTSFVLLFQCLLSIALFYNLLALRFHGWVLQMSFCFFYIYFSTLSLFNPDSTSIIPYFSGIPQILLVPWIIFNGYIIYYFLKPEVREIFFYYNNQKNVLNKEFEDFISYTNSLIEKQTKYTISEPDSNGLAKRRKTLSNIKYIPTARVLIATPKSISELKKMQELNKAIDRNATQIIVMLKKILPQLKESSVIDYRIYDHYQKYSWEKNDIIMNFKLRASQLCSDKSNLNDRFFKYSKKIDEIELLNKTDHLMDSWLKETGNEIGDLISYNYI